MTESEEAARRVLVVDDEDSVRHVVAGVLEQEGCTVVQAASAEEALALLGDVPAVALLDIVLPGMNGLQLLEKIKETSPSTEVVIMTSHASVETTIHAIRAGAYDYIEKPFEDLETIWITVRRAFEKFELRQSNERLLKQQAEHNARLSRAVTRLSSLIDAGRGMAGFVGLDDLLDFFIGLVARDLGVDRASLMLVDESGKHLRIAAAYGVDDVDIEDVHLAIGEGIAGSVAQSGEAFIVRDASADPRMSSRPWNPSLSNSFISAPIVLSIPIISRTTVLGVINVTNRASGVPFDDDDLAYLSGLAGQLAVAVEKTRHFQELQGAYESLKSAQEQLVFSERMKTAGQMAAGVAHDFNNALSVILGRAEFIIKNLSSPSVDLNKILADTEAIKTISLHGAEIIKRIQDYTRIRRDAPSSTVNLNSVIRDAIELTRPKWKEEPEAAGRHLDVQLELDEIPNVSGHVYELTQVVGNLLFNAVDAMPRGGTITFRTAQEQDFVVLDVSDTGVGMPEDVRRRIFEPFFTTKSSGQGLGTSIIYGIVSRHGGKVSVTSELGQGTKFSIRLPACATVGVKESTQGPTTGPAASARILLVEDEPMVREVLTEALACAGHFVVPVEDGIAGAREIEEREFDLVITDLSMPGMSGTDLAKVVKKRSPGTPVILLSGWAIQHEEESVRESGVDHILIKPCLIPKLLSTVQQALATPVEA